MFHPPPKVAFTSSSYVTGINSRKFCLSTIAAEDVHPSE